LATGDETGKFQYEIKPYRPEERLPSTQVRIDEFAHPEEETHLRDYLNVILRRKWIVLVFFSSVVITVALASLLMKPIYKSTAVIRIDKEAPNVLTFKDVQVMDPDDQNYYETQYMILQSRNLAKRTIEKLNLRNDPRFNPNLGENGYSLFDMVTGSVSGMFSRKRANPQDTQPEDREWTPHINRFARMLSVDPVPKSQLVKISFESPSPELAQKAANAVTETYIDFNIDSKVEASQQARAFLEKQIEVLKQKVEASEARLNDYATANEIVFIDESQEKQNILSKKMSEISSSLSAATADRIQAEAIYRETRESGGVNSQIMNNDLIQNLKKEYSTAESEYQNFLKVYKEDFPKMKRLKSQMEALANRIEQEKRSLIRSAENDYKAAKKREAYLTNEFNSNKERVLNFQKKNVQYQILKRDVDANKALYDSLLQRMKEVSVAGTRTSTNIQVLDPAEYPKKPFKPKKGLNILLATLFGFLGGVGLAFFVEYFDNTIKDTSEIENRLRLPTLGLIPQQRLGESIKRPMLIHSKSRGAVAEAFRSIGTFIMLSSSAKPPKAILITSPGEKEGKTTISINTAIAFAESVGNGILIDADLRKPKLHHSFEVDNSIGLSTYLSGNTGLSDGLIKQTEHSGLSLLTSGPICPNPSELLVSKKMKELLEHLQANYDFVVIDSTPVMGMPDSLFLSSIVDGTVLVIRSGHTTKGALRETKKIFRSINAKILGVILNGIKETDLRYNYYSNYYSSYFKEQGL
jgi:succinoglycan biosynthesis transport protein ExoP